MNIRLAQNSDGETIQALVQHAGFAIDGIDWSDVYPYWLVAENGAGVVGCIQVLPAKPIGHLEMLSTRLDNPREKARVVKRLVFSGMAALKTSGAQIAMGTVPFKLKSYKRVLENRGAVVVSRGNIMAKRLT